MPYADHDFELIADLVTGRQPRIVLFYELGEPVPKSYLVDGLIGLADFGAIYGEPGAGKGNLALDLSCHIAAGMPWRGRKVRKGGVLYVALERREQVARRAQAFVKHHGVPTSDYLGFTFAMHTDPVDLRKEHELLRLWHQARFDLFEDDEEAPDLDLIVIDTFSRAIGDGSDSDDRDMQAVAAEVERFTRLTGCGVLIVHHQPVNGEARLRGHGALLGALDTTIHVAKRRGAHIARVVKDNESSDRPSFEFALESVTLHVADDGRETAAPVVVPVGENIGRVEPPAVSAAPSKRLSPAASDILSTLEPGADIETWRAAADRLAVGLTASGRRKRFTRALESILSHDLVGERDGSYWPKRDSGTSGTEDNFSTCPAILSSPAGQGDSGTPLPI